MCPPLKSARRTLSCKTQQHDQIHTVMDSEHRNTQIHVQLIIILKHKKNSNQNTHKLTILLSTALTWKHSTPQKKTERTKHSKINEIRSLSILVVFFSSLPFHLSHLPWLAFSHLVLFIPCITIFSHLSSSFPFYLTATSLLALILHHLFLLSHRCRLSSQFSLPFSLPPSFPLSWIELITLLTIQLSVHCFCTMLFHIMAYGACSTPPSLSLEVFYLPVQCLSVVSGNCMKQIEQVEISKDCDLHFSRLTIKLCYKPD